MFYNFFRIKVLFWGIMLVFGASCNTTKHLDEGKGERLLVKNSLDINAPKKIGSKFELKYNLEGLYKQNPNTATFGMFRTRLALYYKYHDRKSKFAKFVIKRIAEPPAIYSDDLTQRTTRNFQNYMRQRGYFDAICTSETKFSRKKAKVTYTLQFNDVFSIEKFQFASRDSNIQQILNKTAELSLLHAGGALDEQVFDAEKLRITSELKNDGYAFFIPNFVEFLGDSTGKKANITVNVLPLNDTSNHKTYTIGKIAVFSSLVPDYSSIRQDTTIGGIYFASSDPRFLVNPRRLYNAIAFKPGLPYRQKDYDQTYRNLNSLGIFRFVSIKSTQDSLNPSKLDITIAFAPNKRFSFGGGVDFNTSNSNSSIGARLLGTSASLGFDHRNLARGAEHLSSKLSYNIEFDFTNKDRPINSREFSFQNDLTFPRFHDYLGFWKNMSRVPIGKHKHLINKVFFQSMSKNAQERISLNYNDFNVIDFYKSQLFHSSLGYDLRKNTANQYSFDHIGVDVLRPKFGAKFDSLYGRYEFLTLSLGDQLFTGFVLRSLNFSHSGTNNRFGERWSFRFNQELSGAEEFLAYSAYSKLTGKKQPWKLAGLDFSKFYRVDMDGSYTRDFRKDLTAVFRLGSGVILPFGDTETAPYVKQYFIGGPTSIRAWRIREIGPGSFFDPNKPERPPFYQTADYRFEFNSELRFPIFWIFKGAVFLDGGNVWTLKFDESRPGSQLLLKSYKDMAIGTGFGLRVDITYAVIRFDLGAKLRWPYPDEYGNHWVNNYKLATNESLFNLNIAVGYPF